MKQFSFVAALLAAVFTLSACEDQATTANHNMTRAADNFEVERRIVFFNGITDSNLLTVQGFCSITDQRTQLEVLCKTDHGNGFVKHFLGLSDNVSYLVEHLRPTNVSVYHPRIMFRPQTIIPDIDFQGSTDALMNDDSDTMNPNIQGR